MNNLTAIKNEQIISELNDFTQTQKELIVSLSKKYSSRSRQIDLFLLNIYEFGTLVVFC